MISRLFLTACAVGGASSLIYLVRYYNSLSRRVEHSTYIGQLPASGSPSSSKDSSTSSGIHGQLQSIESLPTSFQTEPEKYYVFYDSCSKAVAKSTIAETMISNPSHLLTLLLRRNMSIFATRLPQAWLVRLLISRKIPTLLPTFNPVHIHSLEFESGDVVAGMYRVVLRTSTRVEFDVWLPPGSGIDLPPIEGRLVFSIDLRDSKEVDGIHAGDVLFKTQTLQYKLQEQKGVILPLENTVYRWLHDIASWWLLESGVDWLCKAGREAGDKGEIRDGIANI